MYKVFKGMPPSSMFKIAVFSEYFFWLFSDTLYSNY